MPAALRQMPRVFGLLWLLCAWLVLTNHCALSVARAEKAPVQSGCARCMATQPSPATPAQPDLQECCQTVQATLVTGEDWVKVPVASVQWELSVLAVLLDQAQAEVISPAISLAPPRQFSFAEVVLQHSLLSHAPPQAV